jgi:hypothetical protein
MRYDRRNIDSAIHAAERLSQRDNKKRFVYAVAGGFGIFIVPPLANYQPYYETTGWSTVYVGGEMLGKQ